MYEILYGDGQIWLASTLQLTELAVRRATYAQVSTTDAHTCKTGFDRRGAGAEPEPSSGYDAYASIWQCGDSERSATATCTAEGGPKGPWTPWCPLATLFAAGRAFWHRQNGRDVIADSFSLPGLVRSMSLDRYSAPISNSQIMYGNSVLWACHIYVHMLLYRTLS